MKKTRKIITAAIALLLSVNINAQHIQEYNIDFKTCTFNEAVEMAKKQGKKVFVDCYTVWCGPCKKLAKEVFTQKAVADYYNANFISLKIDMEKGEGINLGKKWGVSSYPTLIYLDDEGEEVHRRIGGGKPEDIIGAAKVAKKGTGIGALARQFKNGNRQGDFILKYLRTLKKAGKTAEMETVVETLLSEQSKEYWTSKTNWLYFNKFYPKLYSSVSEYFLKNREKYINVLGKKTVRSKIISLYKKEIFNFTKYDKVSKTRKINEEGYDKFINSLNTFAIKEKDYLLTHVQFIMAGYDMEKCIEVVEEYLKKDTTIYGTEELYEWSCMIRRKHFDKSVVNKSDEWFQLVIENTDSEELKKKCNDLMTGKTWNPYGMMKVPAMKPKKFDNSNKGVTPITPAKPSKRY